MEHYPHRSGRTARAGMKGGSITFIEEKERGKIARIEDERAPEFRQF